MLEAGELLAVLGEAGIRMNIQISDSNYGVPTSKYLTEDFSKFYEAKLQEMGLNEWNPSWDCDDFAQQFHVMARWAHFATQKSMAESLSVGVIYFENDQGGHAINIAVVDNNKVIFIEPQTAAHGNNPVIELTQKQIESIWFVLF